MRIKLTPAPGALVTVKTKDGRTLTNEQITSIEFVPFFSMPTGPGGVALGETVVGEDNTVDRFELQASGSNGKVGRRDRVEKSVVPAIEKKLAAKKPAAAGGKD